MTTPARAICVIGVSSGATPLNPRYFFQKPPMLMALVSNTYAPSSSHLHGGVRKLRQCTPREKREREDDQAQCEHRLYEYRKRQTPQHLAGVDAWLLPHVDPLCEPRRR